MPQPPVVSLCVLLVAALVLIVYDIWLLGSGGSAATISWQTYLAAAKEPIIPLLLGLVIGLLLGHIFWLNRG